MDFLNLLEGEFIFFESDFRNSFRDWQIRSLITSCVRRRWWWWSTWQAKRERRWKRCWWSETTRERYITSESILNLAKHGKLNLLSISCYIAQLCRVWVLYYRVKYACSDEIDLIFHDEFPFRISSSPSFPPPSSTSRRTRKNFSNFTHRYAPSLSHNNIVYFSSAPSTFSTQQKQRKPRRRRHKERKRSKRKRMEKFYLLIFSTWFFHRTTFQGLSHTHTHTRGRWVDGENVFHFLLFDLRANFAAVKTTKMFASPSAETWTPSDAFGGIHVEPIFFVL